MNTYTKKTKIFALAMIFAVLAAFWGGVAYADSWYPPDIALDDLPYVADWLIKTDGTMYWATAKNGTLCYQYSTAQSTVDAVRDALNAGELVMFGAGTYTGDFDFSDVSFTMKGVTRDTVTILGSLKINNTGVIGQQSVCDITINGSDHNTAGLYLRSVNRQYFSNLLIEDCSNGVELRHSLFNTFDSCVFSSNTVGVMLTYVVGDGTGSFRNNFFGGSMLNNDIGVKVYGRCDCNAFYGCEIESNTVHQVLLLELTGGYEPIGTIFDGCYIENNPANANTLVSFEREDGGAYPSNNQFVKCKFAANAQNLTVINMEGLSNVFEGNMIDAAGSSTQTVIVNGHYQAVSHNRKCYSGSVFTITWTKGSADSYITDNEDDDFG